MLRHLCFSHSNEESLTLYQHTTHAGHRLVIFPEGMEGSAELSHHPFQPICKKARQLLGVTSLTMEKNQQMFIRMEATTSLAPNLTEAHTTVL